MPENVGRGIRPQFPYPVVPGEQVGQLVTVVDRGDVPGVQQGNRLIDAALPLTDHGEQLDGVQRSPGAPTARRGLAARSRPGADGGQQRGDVLVPVRAGVDQRGGEAPVPDVRAQQVERLVRPALPAQQPRQARHRRLTAGVA